MHLSSLVRTGVVQPFGGQRLQTGQDARVTSVEIADRRWDAEPGALVLGVLFDEESAISWLKGLGGGKAAVLAVHPEIATERVEEAAARAGTSLVLLQDGVSWTTAFRTLNSLVSEGGSNELEDLIYESDDLSQLARALAARIENPLTIENNRGDILAYSAHGSEIDHARQESILTGKSPADVLERLTRAGVFRRIYASAEPLRVDGEKFGVRDPRVAMAIREGDRPLGVIWVTELGSKLGPDKLVLLRQAASLAASYMIRHRLEHDLARRVRDDLIREIIQSENASSSRIARKASSVGLSNHTPFEVIVVEPDLAEENVSGLNEAEIQALKHELLQVVSFEAAAFDPEAVCAAVAERIVVLLAAKASAGPRAGSLADQLLLILSGTRATAHSIPVSIGIGTLARDLTHLSVSYEHAGQAARVAKHVYGNDAAMAYEALGVYQVLVQSETMNEGATLSPAVEALAKHDRLKGTEYSRTLEVFLDQFGDRAKTAEILNVHHNTLTYRLKRIKEIAPIDLSDPEARLSAQLEFRAMRLRPSASPSS